VYGNVPPVAETVQPAYALPCVPPGHEVVVMVSGPPALTAATVTVTLEDTDPKELTTDRVYVVVDAGLTDTEPLALVDVNVPGVMEILAAPLLIQLSVVLEPGLMLAGLALNDVMVGADPVVDGGLVGLVVLLVPGSFDDPPQLARKPHDMSKSASMRDAAAAHTRMRLVWPTNQQLPKLIRDFPDRNWAEGIGRAQCALGRRSGIVQRVAKIIPSFPPAVALSRQESNRVMLSCSDMHAGTRVCLECQHALRGIEHGRCERITVTNGRVPGWRSVNRQFVRGGVVAVLQMAMTANARTHGCRSLTLLGISCGQRRSW
jgi:hypothetical protein